MESLTKARVSEADIRAMCLKGFGLDLKAYKELNDGFYNISYLVELTDGREMVLKVAPPGDVDILTYEKDIMAAEVTFYKLCHEDADIPVPSILFEDFDLDIFASPYYFMSKLEGIPATYVKDISPAMRREIYEQLAAYLGRIHRIKGQSFGYISMKDRCQDKSYYECFRLMMDVLFEDAKRVGQDLPFDLERMKGLLEKSKFAFDAVSEPCLVHYDLWDGNIFLKGHADMTIEGLIDFERGFYGDPAADISQAGGYIDLENSDYFWDIYNENADVKVTYDRPMKVRIMCYRLYVFMIMYVETFYRDIDGSFDGQKQWVLGEIPKIMDGLNEALEED